MSFFKKLTSLFSSAGAQERDAFWITVKCNRCGEIIRARVNLFNDLSMQYVDAGAVSYYCHKTLIGEASGERPCFQRVEVELTFDGNRRLTGREISGGTFVDE
jgi:hypothetical protein